MTPLGCHVLPDPSLEIRLPAVTIVGEGKAVGMYMGSAVPQSNAPRYLALWCTERLPVEKLHTGSLPLDRVRDAMDE